METDIAQKRLTYRQSLEATQKRIVEQLSQMPEVEKVILFGSYAAGRRDLFTDLDVIVVMESELDFMQRTAELYKKLQSSVDMDLLVYTPDEFERKRKYGFLRHALDNGEVLYER